MPKKHGFSHGFASLVSFLAAGFLLDIMRRYIPILANLFSGTGERISNFLNQSLGWNIAPEVCSYGIIAFFLAFVWGVCFSFVHSDRKE